MIERVNIEPLQVYTDDVEGTPYAELAITPDPDGIWCRYADVETEMDAFRCYERAKIARHEASLEKATARITGLATQLKELDAANHELSTQLQQLFEDGTLTPNACPWCHHSTRVYDRQVHCENCGTTGPIASHDVGAVLVWNGGTK